MKGIVFTEFVEMVENVFSPDLADELLESVALESGGAYTSVGTYDYRELLALVSRLSEQTGIEVPQLVFSFGKHLLSQFVAKYPSFFEVPDAFAFLENVDRYIHVEVLKLYADAELPTITVRRLNDRELEMLYRSERPFADLAHGLLVGTAEHFGESFEIDRCEMDKGMLFKLKRRAVVPCQA